MSSKRRSQILHLFCVLSQFARPLSIAREFYRPGIDCANLQICSYATHGCGGMRDEMGFMGCGFGSGISVRSIIQNEGQVILGIGNALHFGRAISNESISEAINYVP